MKISLISLLDVGSWNCLGRILILKTTFFLLLEDGLECFLGPRREQVVASTRSEYTDFDQGQNDKELFCRMRGIGTLSCSSRKREL